MDTRNISYILVFFIFLDDLTNINNSHTNKKKENITLLNLQYNQAHILVIYIFLTFIN